MYEPYPVDTSALDPSLIGYIGNILSEEAKLRQGSAAAPDQSLVPFARFKRSTILDDIRSNLDQYDDGQEELENVFDADLGNITAQ